MSKSLAANRSFKNTLRRESLQFYSKLFISISSSSSIELAIKPPDLVLQRYTIGWDDTKRDRGYSLPVAAHPCRAAQFAYPPRLCPLCPKHAIKSAPPQLSTVSYANVGREPYSPRDVESERGERERKKKKKGKTREKEKKKRVRSRRACKIHPLCPPNPNMRSTSVSA